MWKWSSCFNPSHLKFGTALDQAADKRIHGTSGSKLIIEKSRMIRNDTRPPKVIAEEYNIHTSVVHRIQRGDMWKE